MNRKVTVIPATLNPLTGVSKTTVKKRKTAGYARVSTDSKEQKTSYDAQVSYYTSYIKSRTDWEFVKVYTDEGISATNTRHRDGFNEMIEDALAGNIDLIITKSVSRFARNTVDSLVTIRKLKEHGIEVYFEKENIYTLDSKGELLLTIMSSLAQEESRSISENVTWGQRKRFADGKVSLPYKHFLGFRKGADDLPEIVPEEAEIVRKIYRLFISGKTTCAIAKALTEEGIPTPGGKSQWRLSTVESILTNEKYMGAALLQKTYTVDFLTKKKKINEGEIPQYYIENSHQPIISPEDFDYVQSELNRRKTAGRSYSCGSVFAARIVCGCCGSFYGPKVWNSTGKYRRTVWQCNKKYTNAEKCTTPHLSEDEIRGKYMAALNELLGDRERITEDCMMIRSALTDTSEIDSSLASLYAEIEVTSELIKRCVEENASAARDQNEYLKKYNGFTEKYQQLKREIDRLEKLRKARKTKADAIGAFVFEIRELEPFTEFDERLWNISIDHVCVNSDGSFVFHFRTGHQITV